MTCIDIVLPLKMMCANCDHFKTSTMKEIDHANPGAWSSYHTKQHKYTSIMYQCEYPHQKDLYLDVRKKKIWTSKKERCVEVNEFIDSYQPFTTSVLPTSAMAATKTTTAMDTADPETAVSVATETSSAAAAPKMANMAETTP